MHVRCPQCHNPIELVGDSQLSDITCSSYGSHPDGKRPTPKFAVFPRQQFAWGEARFLISGTRARFVIKDVQGDVEIAPTKGAIPGWVKVTALDSTKGQPFSFAIQRSDTNQIARATGVLVGATSWNVKFYSWEQDKPLTTAENWRQLVQSEPLAEQTVRRIDFRWGDRAPTDDVPADYFATVATTELQLPAGNYEFRTLSRDGVRVFMDGKKFMDNWTSRSVGLPGVAEVAEVSLDDKKHTLRIEHFEASGSAHLRFDIRAVGAKVLSAR